MGQGHLFPPGAWLALAPVLLLTAALTEWARRYALRRALIDPPGDRRSHVVPTPRGGGISIAAVMLLVLGALALMAPAAAVIHAGAAGGLLLVAGVGWRDDHVPVAVWKRLLTHVGAGALLSVGFWLGGAGPWTVLVAFLAVPVLVNVWNFMDGIDGLAASQAAMAATAYALLLPGDAWLAGLAWALVAASCAFLPFNFPRARIFLGDVGSGTLGYLLAVLLAWTFERRGVTAVAWPLLLLPLGVFLVDASLTLAWRIVRGERWWTPHVEHAYQRWSAHLGAHWPVTVAYAAWLACGIVILLSAGLGRGVAINIGLPVAWTVAGMAAWLALRTRFRQRPGQGRIR